MEQKTNNFEESVQNLIEEIEQRENAGILEPANALVLKKLIRKAETVEEASIIASLGTTYKKTGFHFDKRLEKHQMGNKIRYFRRNDELSFGEVKRGEPINKLIIGENYYALQNLLIQYKGGIDVIYIDPPYGMDSLRQSSETQYENAITRDNLLSMLYFRLQLAKRLLSKDGVIFCSIDDKNYAYVKCLFDDIFEESGFVASLIIESSVIAGPRRVPAMQGSVVKTAEYCLAYSRSGNNKIIKNLKYDPIDGFDSHYCNWIDVANNKIISLLDLINQTPIIKKRFELHEFKINYESLSILVGFDEVVREWLYSEDIASNIYRKGVKENIEDRNYPYNRLFKVDNKWYVKTESGFYNVFRYCDRIGKSDDYFNRFGERQVRGNLWKGFSSDGGNLEKEGFVSYKNGKKPLRLISQLIDSVVTREDAVILDFFAGSGTTGHAVLEINRRKSNKMTFILCQNNQITEEAPNGIANDITCKRLKRIMTGSCYSSDARFKKPKDFEPYGGCLEVYEIDEVANNCTEEGKTAFDVIDETLYGKERFTNLRDKVEWVCSNFESTQWNEPKKDEE